MPGSKKDKKKKLRKSGVFPQGTRIPGTLLEPATPYKRQKIGLFQFPYSMYKLRGHSAEDRGKSNPLPTGQAGVKFTTYFFYKDRTNGSGSIYSPNYGVTLLHEPAWASQVNHYLKKLDGSHSDFNEFPFDIKTKLLQTQIKKQQDLVTKILSTSFSEIPEDKKETYLKNLVIGADPLNPLVLSEIFNITSFTVEKLRVPKHEMGKIIRDERYMTEREGVSLSKDNIMKLSYEGMVTEIGKLGVDGLLEAILGKDLETYTRKNKNKQAKQKRFANLPNYMKDPRLTDIISVTKLGSDYYFVGSVGKFNHTVSNGVPYYAIKEGFKIDMKPLTLPKEHMYRETQFTDNNRTRYSKTTSQRLFGLNHFQSDAYHAASYLTAMQLKHPKINFIPFIYAYGGDISFCINRPENLSFEQMHNVFVGWLVKQKKEDSKNSNKIIPQLTNKYTALANEGKLF